MRNRSIKPGDPKKSPADIATTWFVVLEQALRAGDRQREEEAKRNLTRLGFVVSLVHPAVVMDGCHAK